MGRNEVLARAEREDIVASLKFIGLVVVLVILPDEAMLFGLNPRLVWLIVVFIAGLSFLGYLLSKLVDPATAIGLMGALGGAVSPGMTITSLAEQARRYPAFGSVYASAAAIAATMLFARNLVVVAIVSPPLARALLLPFAGMAGVGVVVAVLLWARVQTREPPAGQLDTPFRIRSALVFGAVVAAVLVGIEMFELSLPTDATRLGIVLGTVAQLTVYTGVTLTAGVTRMARVVAVILVGSAGSGAALVFLT